MNCWLLGGAVF